jgi:hypothetical protein
LNRETAPQKYEPDKKRTMKTTDKQTGIAAALAGALACTSAQAQLAESTCKLCSLPDENLVTAAAGGHLRMAGKPATATRVKR